MSEAMPEFNYKLHFKINFDEINKKHLEVTDSLTNVVMKFRLENIEKAIWENMNPKEFLKNPYVLELIKEAQNMVDKVGNDYSTSWLEDVLKPFQGEGENE